MQYLLLIYDEPGAYDSLSLEDRQALYEEYGRLSHDLVERGACDRDRRVREQDDEDVQGDGRQALSTRRLRKHRDPSHWARR
jgi:hypothetical protein